MKPVLALLFSLFFGCSGGWSTVGQLPENFKANQALWVDGNIWIFGAIRPSLSDGDSTSQLRGREARVYQQTNNGLHLDHSDNGWFVAADNKDGELWAVRARLKESGTNSDYHLLVKPGPEQEWQNRGPITEALSVGRVVIEGDGCGWIHGAQTLLRTCDGGHSWDSISAPGGRSVINQPLISTGPESAILGGSNLQQTVDGGETWSVLSQSPAHATDGRFVVTRTENGLKIGALKEAEVEWRSEHEGELAIQSVVSMGDNVTVLVIPTGLDDYGAEPVLLESTDGARTLATTKARQARYSYSIWVNSPNEAALITQKRKLKIRRVKRK